MKGLSKSPKLSPPAFRLYLSDLLYELKQHSDSLCSDFVWVGHHRLHSTFASALASLDATR
jgi:hypothetical protein